MIGSVETTAAKTATEINTKAQGQMTRLSMLVDTINQDFILPNVEKVAKLCADFKTGVETVFINKENQPETIEVDDSVRQADYKYTYSDSSNTALKSEQADMLVQAVEKFKAAGLEINLPEIFVWYFEQKGVDNAERFLALGVNEGVNAGVNKLGVNASWDQNMSTVVKPAVLPQNQINALISNPQLVDILEKLKGEQ
jgi:hypothetical protein